MVQVVKKKKNKLDKPDGCFLNSLSMAASNNTSQMCEMQV